MHTYLQEREYYENLYDKITVADARRGQYHYDNLVARFAKKVQQLDPPNGLSRPGKYTDEQAKEVRKSYIKTLLGVSDVAVNSYSNSGYAAIFPQTNTASLCRVIDVTPYLFYKIWVVFIAILF